MANEVQTSSTKDILIQELISLKSNFDKIDTRFSLNTKSKISDVLNLLEKNEPEESGITLPGEKKMKNLFKDIGNMNLKPNKGRLKDLEKIHLFVKRMTSTFQKTS